MFGGGIELRCRPVSTLGYSSTSPFWCDNEPDNATMHTAHCNANLDGARPISSKKIFQAINIPMRSVTWPDLTLDATTVNTAPRSLKTETISTSQIPEDNRAKERLYRVRDANKECQWSNEASQANFVRVEGAKGSGNGSRTKRIAPARQNLKRKRKNSAEDTFRSPKNWQRKKEREREKSTNPHAWCRRHTRCVTLHVSNMQDEILQSNYSMEKGQLSCTVQ